MNSDRHAYLILAHNEFQVLIKLIALLDDKRNDIFIHLDKKTTDLPDLFTTHSKLKILEQRIDVRWGHSSTIDAEYLLFEEAYKGCYGRYHLISGTHLPVKSQDYLHGFFNKRPYSEFINKLSSTQYEIDFKFKRYHLFLFGQFDKRRLVQEVSRFLGQLGLKIQKTFRIYRSKHPITFKANNWVSITHQFAQEIIEQKRTIRKRFKLCFCADELLVPYVIQESNVRYNILDCKFLLFNEIGIANARVINYNDVEVLLSSDYLFARKFSSTNMDAVDKVFDSVQKVQNSEKE